VGTTISLAGMAMTYQQDDAVDTQHATTTSRERLTNVNVIEAAVSSTNLPMLSCDAIVIRDAYHHFTAPEAIIKGLAASLKPGGRLAVIDFSPRPDSDVPTGVPANRGGHGAPPEVVEREVRAAWTHIRTIAPWWPASLPASLYLVLFRRPSQSAPVALEGAAHSYRC
jgi:SAM-dependent methyltransferase